LTSRGGKAWESRTNGKYCWVRSGTEGSGKIGSVEGKSKRKKSGGAWMGELGLRGGPKAEGATDCPRGGDRHRRRGGGG